MGEKGVMYEHQTLIPNELNKDDPAIVFLDDDLIEPSTEKQIQAMLKNPSIRHARVMPDCHVGHGCCVGFTAHVSHERIVPAYVGGDIGCGVLTYPLQRKKLNFIRVERIIKNLIPMGNGFNNVHQQQPIIETFILEYLQAAQYDANQFAKQSNLSDDIIPTFDINYLKSLCHRIGIDYNYCLRSFGTLGGGNHFIEINEDEEEQELYLTIHCGSRSFGMKLFEYHNQFLDKEMKCLLNEAAINYCFEMILTQHLARMNRYIILQLILRELNFIYDSKRIIESIHNYIDFSTMILRKGAIAANDGQLCLVALNMRDGMLLCTGKGHLNWNNSCAHGCGRIMSRHEAKKRIQLKDYQQAMIDVISTSVCSETIDEAPQAYKDMNIIIHALEPTISIIKQLKTVLNLKGID